MEYASTKYVYRRRGIWYHEVPPWGHGLWGFEEVLQKKKKNFKFLWLLFLYFKTFWLTIKSSPTFSHSITDFDNQRALGNHILFLNYNIIYMLLKHLYNSISNYDYGVSFVRIFQGYASVQNTLISVNPIIKEIFII